uniref:G-protein coupled receptors family 3 profile domain-containing protein n=1 Tax=Setaria digitata TaxID=48799 RepID=A0A915PZJ0_9BILA
MDERIGALFPLHYQITGTEACGRIWEQYGIQRMEIALSTVEELNALLPFRLGISIRDSCWTDRIAMEQSIAFLREGVGQCPCSSTPGCQKKTAPVVAIVGPAKSSTTIAVQNLLQVFHIPQIGYGATTADLSDKEQYGYFMRVVPADTWQAKLVVAMLEHFNWTYVAVIYSAGNYGEKGFEELERMINSDQSENVCIAYSEKVKSLAEPAEFEKILNALSSQKSVPQVVVCFCEGLTMHGMFKAQQRLRKKNPKLRPFQWICTDGWNDRLDVVDGVELEAAGSFSIRIHSPHVKWFDQYYFSLNPENNTLNPWFREFWQEKFNCQFTVPKDDLETKDAKLSQVVNSIRVVGLALQALYNDRCKENSTMCTEIFALNGTLLLKYMLNVTFVDQFNQEIYFDANGDPPAWYDVLNYVGGKEGFRMVGEYRKKRLGKYRLKITEDDIMFYDKTNQIPESVCSQPCKIGQRLVVGSVRTVWRIKLLITQLVCVKIVRLDACHPLLHEGPNWSSTGIILALLLASIGTLMTLFTVLIFIRYNHTPVVKSTTRELSYIILSGITICYAVSYAVLATPCFATCFLSRTLPPVAFSMIYSALLTKTNRIARILAGSKKRILTKKPRFLSTSSQVVITWILVCIECIIVAVGVIEEMPQAGFDPYYQPQRMVLVCSTTTFAFLTPFLWNLFLISLCTLYAVKTRNLPENFNEAKFIGFTMYCTLVVWSAFIVLHLGTTNKALTMSFSFSLSASIALVLLFFPKLYIILLHPEKNVRASYTTTKLIRCHFGNSQTAERSGRDTNIWRSGSSQQSISRSDAGSQIRQGYRARKASVHVSRSPSQDASTQTESIKTSSKFARTFSIISGSANIAGTSNAHQGIKQLQVDDEVQQLIDSCRRYQVSQDEQRRLHGSVKNLLLEEKEEQNENIGCLLADSMRTVLSTVSRQVLPALPGAQISNEDNRFEQLLKSRGMEPLHLTNATPL